jgi:uncharacterized lipoprotein YbaY/heat shock protein HslJ
MFDVARRAVAFGALAVFSLLPIGHAAEQATLSGTAIYRERMLLPPGAVFEASLIDASRADAPAEVIAITQVMGPRGSPIKFKLRYDPARIEPQMTYSVRGRISVGGTLLFVTDTAHSVLTRGNPNTVQLLLKRVRSQPAAPTGQASAAPAGRLRGMYSYMADAGRFRDCASGRTYPVATEADNAALERAYSAARSEPGAALLVALTGRIEQRPKMEGEGTQASLVVEKFEQVWPGEQCPPEGTALANTRWRLVGLGETGDERLPEKNRPWLRFTDKEARVHGFSGCNNVMGSYRLEGDGLQLGQLVSTQMFCQDTAALERAFLDALKTATGYRIDGGTLVLTANGAPLATFVATSDR